MYAVNPNGTLKWDYHIGVPGIYSAPIIGGNRILYFVNYLGDLTSIRDVTASASPVGGTYNNVQSVTLKMGKPGNIYYTLNGTIPTTASTKYSSPIVIYSNKTLKFLAVDIRGNKSPVYTQIYMVNDTVKPTVTSIDPKNSAVNVPIGKTIKLTFNENIKVGSTAITLKNSAGKSISFTKSINGKVLTIKPKGKLAESKYKLTLNTGSITDMAGNLLKTKTITFSVGTSPKVSKSDPKNGATKIARTKTIKITFSENIKAGSSSNYSKITLTASKGPKITIKKSIKGKTLTITHSKLKANTKYKVTLYKGSLTDKAGNPLAAKTITFTTRNT